MGRQKDQDGEFSDLTHYDYGFRIYNPSIARFLSVDPLSREYPWYTPYQFAGNKPIVAIDLDGLEELIMIYSRTVSNDINEHIKNYGIESAIARLHNHNYNGKYPDGVVNTPFSSPDGYSWLQNVRGRNLEIPNIIAEHKSNVDFLKEGQTMLITVKDSEIKEDQLEITITLFQCDEVLGQQKINLTAEGGIVVYGDGVGSGELDVSRAGNSNDGYSSVEWTSVWGGGGAGTNNAFLRGFKYVIGLMSRKNKIEGAIEREDSNNYSVEEDKSNEPYVYSYDINVNENLEGSPPKKGKDIDTIQNGQEVWKKRNSQDSTIRKRWLERKRFKKRPGNPDSSTRPLRNGAN